ncbi:S8 family serine peptidase [Pontibacter sp. MBLB2868]|uniref:S8 family serine peptidase n=1 Tax=Pontibacter sp. MBLB2868 TaxID=3451555 RepID=UPI003F74FC8A
MLECVRWVPGENAFEATFGYNNPSKTDVTIPPENNTLSCSDIKTTALPTTYKPGRVFSAFSVIYTCPELTWTVTGPSGKPKSVTANGSSTPCATGGSILPNLGSPQKTDSKIGSELGILPGYSSITSDNVYQIEVVDGVQYVFIKLTAMEGKTAALLSNVTTLGLKKAEVSGLEITGWLPVSKLNDLNALENLNLAMPVFTPVFSSGAVTSQGDAAQRTNLTRSGFNVQGEGIKIGVLSDSYNARTGNEAALDIKQGDLPGPGNANNITPVQVLKDLPESSGLGTDEGRAMLQIIHDVAPKAALAFRTGFDGPIDLAQGIRELKNAGCNILVDDITYISDPYFSDGIVAQAVDEVTAQGVTYFSAAGNFGDKSYQGTFTPLTLADSRVVHNFGSGDYLQRLFLPEGSYTLALQWVSTTDQDLDFYLTDDSGNIIIGYNRKSAYPFESMTFHVSAGGAVANIMVVNASAVPDPTTFLKYIIFRGNAGIGEFNSGNSTITGHANAAGAIAVGAVWYKNTPSYGVTPPTIASFSSRGGTSILRDATSKAINITRVKPDFAAPNGGNTTVPLGGVNEDGDQFPNFYGTSAAAPHAAAAAALLMQAHKKYAGSSLIPAAVRSLLRSTALDMGTAGFDKATGFGFIRTDAAISTFATPTPIAEGFTTPEGIAVGKKIVVNGYYFKGTPTQSVSKIEFGGVVIPTTFISETQLQATIPTITGNPAIRVCNPATSISGLDGGCSKPLYLYPKTVVTVKAGNFTKRYGDVMPTLKATITNGPDYLQSANIQFTTLATDISDVGAYIITPSIASDNPIFSNTDQYEVVYENGILLIEKIPLQITANDVAIAEGDPISGFNYSYSFPVPINNTPERIQLIKDNLRSSHLALQTTTSVLVSESELLNVSAIRNRSFLVSATAEANASRVINGSRVMNVSSELLNALALDELNATRVMNAMFLMNASRVINGSRVMNGSRVINASRVMNSNTVGEANNEKAILILDESDEVLNTIYAANLITGYTLGSHLWSPATLLSNNFDVSYGEPGNFFVNPIGTGVRAVKPSLDCVQPSKTPGYYIAHFSYDNPNDVPVRLPEGSENRLISSNGYIPCFVYGTKLPKIFQPGKHYAFSVEFDGNKLSWDLTSFQGTKKTSIASNASSTSSKCKVAREDVTCIQRSTNVAQVSSADKLLDAEDNAIAVYPNPAGAYLKIDLSGHTDEQVTITMYDVLGKAYLKDLTLKNGTVNEIKTTELGPGLYFIKLSYGDKIKHISVLKQ